MTWRYNVGVLPALRSDVSFWSFSSDVGFYSSSSLSGCAEAHGGSDAHDSTCQRRMHCSPCESGRRWRGRSAHPRCGFGQFPSHRLLVLAPRTGRLRAPSKQMRVAGIVFPSLPLGGTAGHVRNIPGLCQSGDATGQMAVDGLTSPSRLPHPPATAEGGGDNARLTSRFSRSLTSCCGLAVRAGSRCDFPRNNPAENLRVAPRKKQACRLPRFGENS